MDSRTVTPEAAKRQEAPEVKPVINQMFLSAEFSQTQYRHPDKLARFGGDDWHRRVAKVMP
jgi:hypothetical protein